MTDFQRAKSPFVRAPLTYWRVGTSKAQRGNGALKYTALAVCPNGHQALLDEHVIEDDGTVTPSVVCEPLAPDTCDFHDYIRLVDWENGNA